MNAIFPRLQKVLGASLLWVQSVSLGSPNHQPLPAKEALAKEAPAPDEYLETD